MRRCYSHRSCAGQQPVARRPGRLSAEEAPLRAGAAVFENSTACAPSDLRIRECVQVRCRSVLRGATGTEPRQGRGTLVYRVPHTETKTTLIRTCRPSGPARVVQCHGEFDPGSGRTLAACLTHASGATNRLRSGQSRERVSNTWVTYPDDRDNPRKLGLIPDVLQLHEELEER